ncbi:sigma-54-dependent transcriptional regulator [Bryobacter aggregatus]|uniref:sigma-54-dependent transcriptional regulator n=1 Tax=Bryobacter aggregatus TaxID=360054 RepID=UPI0004E20AB3|nr:sigma-54 dependent transcriptional regulator [Bryobacter aggregatus]
MQEFKARVLVVDDEENQRRGLSSLIGAWGYEVRQAQHGEEALEILEVWPAQLVVSDMMMPVMDGPGLLARLREQPNPPQSIVVTAFGSLETALKTIHELGAFWFLEKPLDTQALKLLLDRALTARRLSEDKEVLERQLSYDGRLGGLVGQTPVMQELYRIIQQVAPTKASVLITGESGTGKEVVARAIHGLSSRTKEQFVALNCAALPESLIESELFGHEKGAFTGALERRAGCFELAHRGTLLLDEIGEMPVSTQAKLLRVLEDGRVRRLGGKSEMEVDVRILAATNRKLEDAISKGTFREDLFYRLNVFRMELAPLRERMDDLPILCETLIQQLNHKHEVRVSGIEETAMLALRRRQWQGNIRELRNVIERAVILAGEGLIRVSHLPTPPGTEAPPVASNDPETIVMRVGTTVDDAEKALIFKTLEHTKQNKTRAAEILAISLKTLHNKLKQYGADDT